MAYAHQANAIVCDSGTNAVTGVVDIDGVVVNGTSASIQKNGVTVATLPTAGHHNVKIRSASGLTVVSTGGTTSLLLRLSTHK